MINLVHINKCKVTATCHPDSGPSGWRCRTGLPEEGSFFNALDINSSRPVVGRAITLRRTKGQVIILNDILYLLAQR
jgi:hypothetical protein